jgi:hypothetical protein
MGRKAKVEPVKHEKKVVIYQSFFHTTKPKDEGQEKTALVRALKGKGYTVEKAFYATRLPSSEGFQHDEANETRMFEVIKAAVVYAIESKAYALFVHSKHCHWSGIDLNVMSRTFTGGLDRQVICLLELHGVRLAIVDLKGEVKVKCDSLMNFREVIYMRELHHALKANDNKMKGQRLAKGRAVIKAKAGKCEGVKGWGDYPDERIAMLKAIRMLRRLPKGCTKRRSFQEIADALNAQGKLSFTGKLWSASGVANFYSEWHELPEERQKAIARRTRAIKKARKGKDEATAIEGEEAYDDASISDEEIERMASEDAEAEADAAKAQDDAEKQRKAREEHLKRSEQAETQVAGPSVEERIRQDRLIVEINVQIGLMRQRGMFVDIDEAKRLAELKLIEEDRQKREAAHEATV